MNEFIHKKRIQKLFFTSTGIYSFKLLLSIISVKDDVSQTFIFEEREKKYTHNVIKTYNYNTLHTVPTEEFVTLLFITVFVNYTL